MRIELTALEARVLGCLMEKSVITPEQYPLTLNALTNACNQKSSRDPVLSLDPGTVQRTARQLADRHLVTRHENFRSGVEKYEQRLCNTTFGMLQFSTEEFAIICLLLLRGPQTPGELRARAGRLCEFADNEAVRTTLAGLMQREDGPFVARLARAPGRHDSAWTHLLGGTEESLTVEPPESRRGAADEVQGGRISALEARIAELEQAVSKLAQRLDTSTHR